MNFVDFLFHRPIDRNAPLLVGKDECNYGKLIDDVTTLSSGIRKRYGKGNEIVLMSDNNYFFILSYLAIIKSENTVLLLDPRTGTEVVQNVLKDSKPVAYFIQNKFVDDYKEFTAFTENDLSSLFSDQKVPSTLNDDDLAVVVFTSGSTGGKKGVMISHRNLIANTSSIVEYLALDSKDRILVALPFHYCYGASLLHTHLKVGGSLVLFDANFLGAVPEYINKYSCTGFAGVPSTYQILIARSKFLKKEMPTLRYMTQAGGKLENVFIKQVVDAFPSKRFFVMYGATEATARMSYLPPERLVDKLGSIGKGIPNVRLCVVDENGMQVKPGEVGEIHAKGENIMMGYYHDPEGTSSVIRNGEYCTGDLATVDDEGFIFVVGRIRDIIKSAGYRISPYEIENLICEIEGVAGCAVIGVPDEIMGEAVVAVVKHNGSVTEDELKDVIMLKCKRALASYKAPKRIVFKDELPLNASNKVDKISLKKELSGNGAGK